jgi:hypothetical protein
MGSVMKIFTVRKRCTRLALGIDIIIEKKIYVKILLNISRKSLGDNYRSLIIINVYDDSNNETGRSSSIKKLHIEYRVS